MAKAQINGKTNAITGALDATVDFDFLDGLMENEEDSQAIEDSLTEHMKDLVDAINGVGKLIVEAVEGLGGKVDGGEKGSGGGKVKGAKSGGSVDTGKNNSADLKGLGIEYGLGFVVIANKLDQILANQKKGGDGGKGKDKNPFKSFFEGAGALAGTIALLAFGFLAFAAAMALGAAFNIDFGKSLAMLVLFEVFIVANVGIAKLVKTNMQNFKNMAEGVLLLTIGFALFSVCLIVAAFCAPYLKKALPVLGWFGLFVFGAALIGKMCQQYLGQIVQLGIFSILMVVTLGLFSVCLVLMAKVTPYILEALKTFGVFIIFMALCAALGYACTFALAGLALFAVASILLTASLLLFTAAMYVMSLLDYSVVLQNTLVIMASVPLFLTFTLLMPILLPAIVGILLFTVASVLLLAAAIPFGLSMLIFSIINPLHILKATLIALATIPMFVAFTALGVASVVAIPFLGMFTVAAVVMLTASLVLLGIMKTMEAVAKIQVGTVLVGVLAATGAVLAIATTMSLAAIPLAIACIFVGSYIYNAKKVAEGVNALARVVKDLDVMGSIDSGKLWKGVDALKVVVKQILPAIVDALKPKLSFSWKKGFTREGGVPEIGGDTIRALMQVNFAVSMMTGVIKEILKVGDMMTSESEDMQVKLESGINAIMKTLSFVIATARVGAEALANTSKKDIRKMNQAITPIADAICKITDPFIKLMESEADSGAADKAGEMMKEMLKKLTDSIIYTAIYVEGKDLKGAVKTINKLNEAVEPVKNIISIDVADDALDKTKRMIECIDALRTGNDVFNFKDVHTTDYEKEMKAIAAGSKYFNDIIGTNTEGLLTKCQDITAAVQALSKFDSKGMKNAGTTIEAVAKSTEALSKSLDQLNVSLDKRDPFQTIADSSAKAVSNVSSLNSELNRTVGYMKDAVKSAKEYSKEMKNVKPQGNSFSLFGGKGGGNDAAILSQILTLLEGWDYTHNGNKCVKVSLPKDQAKSKQSIPV